MASPISRFNSSRTRSMRWEGMRICASLKFGRDLLGGVGLDDVADLEIVIAIDADAALHAGADFIDFVLEAAEGLDDTLEEDVLAAADADLALDDTAVGDDAAGDIAAFGQLEQFA